MGGSVVSHTLTAGATTYCASDPSRLPLEPFWAVTVAVAARNGSDNEREELLSWHTAASAVHNPPPPNLH